MNDPDSPAQSALSETTHEGDSAAELDQAREPIDSLDDLHEKDVEQNIKLRGGYAVSVLIGLGIQVIIEDVVFFFYGFGVDWRIPTPTIMAWLASTVVQSCKYSVLSSW